MNSKSGKDELSQKATTESRENKRPASRFIKRFVFALIPVTILFGGTELGLRFWGYKYKPWVLDQDIFVSAGRGYLRTSPQFVGTAPYGFEFCVDQHFLRKKRAGTIRVFMLGGSSVMRLGAAKYLRDRLEADLKKPVEIINMGFSSGGSDRVLRAVEEAVRLDPDVLLVYSGHNEFYSLLSWDTTFDCRIVQWLQRQRLNRYRGNKFNNPRFDTDREKQPRYAAYKKNLQSIASIAQRCHVPLVIGTVSSNYLIASGDDDSERIEKLKNMHIDQLREQYHNNENDSTLAFAYGYRMWEQREYEEARKLLNRTISLSSHPGRADETINATIKNVASEANVVVADVESVVQSRAEGGIPGPNLFDDHCHLNEKGNRILMDTFAESIVELLNR